MRARTAGPAARLDALLARVASGRPDRRVPLLLLTAGTILLGQGMSQWIRREDVPYLAWLAAAVVLVVAGVVAGGRLERLLPPGRADRLLVLLLGVGIIAGTLTILVVPNALPLPKQDGAVLRWADARTLVVLAGVVGLSGLLPRPPLGPLHLPVLCGLVLVLGLWIVATSHWPAIDVFFFERDAGIRLGQLTSPYSGTTTNIYGGTAYYAEGFATNQKVLFGYPYPPVPLLVTSAGQILGDEPRTGLVVAIVAAGAIVGAMRRDPVGRGAAALLLLTPALPFLLREAFIEPVMIVLLAATVAAAHRSPRATALFLGLFLFSKQYCLVALPLVPLLVRAGAPLRETIRLTVLAVLVAALLVLPFLLWDASGFVRSVFAIILASPDRADSFGFGPLIVQAIGSVPAVLFAAVGAGAVLVALWRAPWTPSGFAAATGFVTLLLVAISRASFPNYYLLVIGALCVAIAAARPEEADAGAPAEGRPSAGAATT
ncbi:MAG: hypothetical protein ACKOTZ_12930 [Chloroflexota bacterium]